MNDRQRTTDELLAKLGEARPPAADPAFRARLLAETGARVARRAQRPRWTATLALTAAAYAAGLLTWALVNPAGLTAPQHDAPQEIAQAPAEGRPATPEEPKPAGRRPVVTAIDPQPIPPWPTRADYAKAWAAMSGEAQIAYLRKSADWRLKQYTDIAGATELYRRMLELLPPERRTATAKEDTWLLRRLKHDMKETPNAHART